MTENNLDIYFVHRSHPSRGGGYGPHPSPIKIPSLSPNDVPDINQVAPRIKCIVSGWKYKYCVREWVKPSPSVASQEIVLAEERTCVPPRKRLSKPSSPVLFYLCGAGWRRVPKPKNPSAFPQSHSNPASRRLGIHIWTLCSQTYRASENRIFASITNISSV